MIRINQKFYDSEVQRGVQLPALVKQTQRFYWIAEDDAALPDFYDLAVAVGWADVAQQTPDMRATMTSARVTAQVIEEALGGKPERPVEPEPAPKPKGRKVSRTTLLKNRRVKDIVKMGGGQYCLVLASGWVYSEDRSSQTLYASGMAGVDDLIRNHVIQG